MTKLNQWINQGQQKELTRKTQLINQGLFQELIYLIKVLEQKPLRNRYLQTQFKFFVLSGQGESLSSVTPVILCIPCKNKRKKSPYTSIIKNQLIK